MHITRETIDDTSTSEETIVRDINRAIAKHTIGRTSPGIVVDGSDTHFIDPDAHKIKPQGGDKQMTEPMFQSKDNLEKELDNWASKVKLILEEFARRDSGESITDHHKRGLDEEKHEEVTNQTNEALSTELNEFLSFMAFPALVYETRFRDSYYTNIIYNGLLPLKGEG